MSKLTLTLESVPNGTVKASYYGQGSGDDHVQSLKKTLLDLFKQDGSVSCREVPPPPEPPKEEAKAKPEPKPAPKPEPLPKEITKPAVEPAGAETKVVSFKPKAKKITKKKTSK